MKNCRVLLGLCLALALVASAQTSARPEEAVKQVITDFAVAWNRHDVPAMAALHTTHVNFTNIGGQWWRGRDEVAAGLQNVHATVFSKSTMTIQVDEVRFLANDIAVVHGHMELHNVPPSAQGPCVYMRVLVREQGKWLIDDFQNTLIRPPDTH